MCHPFSALGLMAGAHQDPPAGPRSGGLHRELRLAPCGAGRAGWAEGSVWVPWGGAQVKGRPGEGSTKGCSGGICLCPHLPYGVVQALEHNPVVNAGHIFLGPELLLPELGALEPPWTAVGTYLVPENFHCCFGVLSPLYCLGAHS